MNIYHHVGKALWALLAVGLTVGLSAGQALAVTAQNATIVNVVKVDYSDASGNGAYTASDSATVTVELLAATPTISAPAPASGQTVDSGAEQAYIFTMYGNANGTDLYDFALTAGTTGNSGSPTSSNEYIYSYTSPNGALVTTGNTTTKTLADLTIGASVILSNTVTDTINVPAGTLNNLAAGDFVVINGVVYVVNATTPGSIASQSGDILTAETNATISLYEADGSTAVVFNATDLTGAVISERWLVDVRATAVTTGTADAVTYFNVSLTDDGLVESSASVADIQTTFLHSQVAVTKTASVASAKPGEEVEYTVAIVVSGSDATSVTVLDAVPEYTTLVTYSDSYAGTAVYSPIAASAIFASIDDGSSIVDATTAVDDEGDASGDAGGNAAGQALKFFLGASSDGTTGGTVAAGTTYTIKYTVRID